MKFLSNFQLKIIKTGSSVVCFININSSKFLAGFNTNLFLEFRFLLRELGTFYKYLNKFWVIFRKYFLAFPQILM